MKTRIGILGLLAILLCSGEAQAHLRNYLVTYPYWTPPRGSVELEMYNDFNDTDSGETVFVNKTEIEYGVTDRFALGVYAVSEKSGGKPLEYAKTKIEARYRLAQPWRLPVDPALYFEYQIGANGRADKTETKLLLSKDFGGSMEYNVSFNGILEKSRAPGSEWEKGYALGISRVISPKATAGVEFTGGGGKTYVIPGAYITLGSGTRLNVGGAFGLSKDADDFQLKTLMEYEFF
ncbi:MAG: hypothetical protein ACYC64_05570 [Armatimonadota bacterium]